MTDRGGTRAKQSSTATSDPRHDLAGVLHDVSNVLTVLLGWVAEAGAEGVSPEAQRYALAIVEQRARMARDLARHAIGGAPADEAQAIGVIARDVVEGFRLSAAEGERAIRLTGDDVRAPVGAALDVSQVLTNIVLNALAHAPAGSEIVVDVAAGDDRVEVVVSDRGAGVPPELRERIFAGESFRPGGTGVGLRHSREVARAAGGDVELLAATPGFGARFRASWPRADALPRPPAAPSKARELLGKRVLVVEDDPAVKQLLETALEARGAEVTVASTNAEFDAAVGKTTYQVALLDLSPIAADAAGAIRGLKASSPGIDLVLISGSADRLPESIPAGELKLVRKPFELSEVLAALVAGKS